LYRNNQSEYWKHHKALIEYFTNEADRINVPRRLTGENQAVWLYDLVQQTNNDAWICEVGSLYGYLTVVLGLACIGTNRRVAAIDHMIGSFCMDMETRPKCIYQDFVDALHKFGVWEKVIPFPMKSYGNNAILKHKHEPVLPLELIKTEYLQAHEMLTIMNIEFELIYLDGNHLEENVYNELCLYTKLLKIGGVIGGDDYMPKTPLKGVAKAVQDFFQGNDDYKKLDVPGNQFGYKRVR